MAVHAGLHHPVAATLSMITAGGCRYVRFSGGGFFALRGNFFWGHDETLGEVTTKEGKAQGKQELKGR